MKLKPSQIVPNSHVLTLATGICNELQISGRSLENWAKLHRQGSEK